MHMCETKIINLCSNFIWQGVVNVEMMTIWKSLKTHRFKAAQYFYAKELKAEIIRESTEP